MNLLFLLSAASAQEETFDAHGLTIVPEDGDLRDGLVTWRAENLSEKRGSIGLLVEYADENLVEYVEDIDGITETPLLDDLMVGHLRGTFAFGERVGLGLVLPVVISSEGISGAGGFGVGDARLAAPIGLILPDKEGTGFGFSVVPYADLPIGDEERFLGDAGLSGGGMLAAGLGLSRLQLNSNVGLDFSPATSVDSWTGGAGLVAGLGASALITEGFAVGLEGQARPLLSASSVAGTHVPAEAVLSGRGRADSGLGWNIGAAVPLSQGATAAQLRVFAGLGMSFGVDPGATLNIQVVDDDGLPVPGATVQTDKGTLTTDAAGSALLGDNRTGAELNVQASMSGYEPDTAMVTLETGENTTRLTLSAMPSAVNLLVRAQDGTPVDAVVTPQGVEAMEPVSIGEDGAELIGLHHGTWTLSISADGYESISREVSLAPGEESPLEVVVRAADGVADAGQEPAEEPVVEPEPVVEQPDPVVEPEPAVELTLPTVYFSYNSSTLTSKARGQLRTLARQLESDPSVKLNIYGHTDVRGDESFNNALGQLRSEAVVRYLSEQGVSSSRLRALSSGETRVASTGTTESAHAQNRRVTFSIR